MRKIYSHCPIVLRETLLLHQHVKVGDSDYEWISRERQILWLRESESKLTLLFKGNVIDKLCTTNDYYGFLTSPSIDECQRFAGAYQCELGDQVAVAMDVEICDKPVMKDSYQDSKYKMSYLELPRDCQFFLEKADYPKNFPGVQLESKHVATLPMAFRSDLDPCDKMPERLERFIAEQKAAAEALVAEIQKGKT